MKTIQAIAKVVNIALGVILSLLLALFLADFVWSNFITDDAYREGMDDSGSEKVLIGEMRAYFHGRASYPAMTLAELHKKGILSDDTYDFVRSTSHPVYCPFSPDTPRTAVVFRYGPPLIGEVLHKGDFTAGPQDGDIVVNNGDFSF